MSELARDWQVWAAENLLRGVSRAEIEARLADEGVPADVAAAALDAIEGSPALEAARTVARDARRWAMLAGAHELQARQAARPRAIVARPGIARDDFFDQHVATGVPCLLPGLAASWADLAQLTPRAIADRWGEVAVEVTTDRENDPDYERTFRRRARTIAVRELVACMERGPSNDVYLVAQNLALERTPLRELLALVDAPEGWLAPGEHASLWMGPAGTITPFHHDATSILVLQLHGRKRWRLIAPTERAWLARMTAPHTLLDPERDGIDGVLVREVLVGEGDALFVPVGWWHHVEALAPSVTISLTKLAGAGDLGFFRPNRP